MSYKYCTIYKEGEKLAFLNDVRIPIGFYHNAKGLLGEKLLKENTGMLFEKCKSIHMFGMRTALDIIFLSPNGTILKCVVGLSPWKITTCLKANMVLELPTGTIEKEYLKPLMKLEIKPCPNLG